MVKLNLPSCELLLGGQALEGLAHLAASWSYVPLLRKQISITVILSHPRPPICASGARQVFNRSSQIYSSTVRFVLHSTINVFFSLLNEI